MWSSYTSTLSLTPALDGVGSQRKTPAALPPRKIRFPFIGSWVGPRAGLEWCGKSRPPPPPGIWSPGFQFRSESLYRLSYTGPQKWKSTGNYPVFLPLVHDRSSFCNWLTTNPDHYFVAVSGTRYRMTSCKLPEDARSRQTGAKTCSSFTDLIFMLNIGSILTF